MRLVTLVPLAEFIECNQATVTLFDFGDKQYVAKLSPEIAEETVTWDKIEPELANYPNTWVAYFINVGRFGDSNALDCLAFTELMGCRDGEYYATEEQMTYWGWLYSGKSIISNPNNHPQIHWLELIAHRPALDAIYHHLAATCNVKKH